MALENAGYITNRVSKNIGVFAGMSSSIYYEDRIKPSGIIGSTTTDWEVQTMIGQDYLATMVSYLLGLTGLALNINTACSTSLVAIIEACKNLVLGTCDIALSGGVSLMDEAGHGYIYSEGMIFSKDGHCRVFDEQSNGTVPGMGVGVVALKRLEDAKKDGDNIIAVIKGYWSNNDGNNKIGFTAPSVFGQKECILAAQKMAKITSDTIGYIEAHGTGTALGDPIEVAALHDAFINNTSGTYDCFIGSVKANIGHVDIAAGIAGFIKVCNMLNKAIIPPQINFTKANPNINLPATHFKIAKEKIYWDSKDYPRRAAVSSFGIGGTNAHVILEEYQTKSSQLASKNANHTIIPISAKSHESYARYCRALANYLKTNPDVNLTNVGYTLQLKREHFKYRNCIIAKNVDEALINISSSSQISHAQLDDPTLVFMFPGQGSQYTNMSRDLYQQNAVFRYYVDISCQIVETIKGSSLKNIIFSSDENSKKLLNRTLWSQLALFTVSFSLAKLLEHLGVEAAHYIGHSLGEYVAATLSGVFTLEEALKIVAKRGEIMESMQEGKMLAINIDEQSLLQILPETLEIAAYNAQAYQVVSGAENDIDKFIGELNRQNIQCKKLYTSHAFHSKMMQPAVNVFKNYLKDFNFKKPQKPFISNSTGEFILDHQATSIEYWADHIRLPVKFVNGIHTLNKVNNNGVYIEVGAGNTLATFVKQFSDNKVITTLPSSKESETQSDLNMFYESVGKLWSYGINVSWEQLNEILDHVPAFISNLPNYQFAKDRYSIERSTNYETKNHVQINWTYSISWQRIKAFSSQEAAKILTKTVIVFKDKFGITDFLIQCLKERGNSILTLEYDEDVKDLTFEGAQIYINPYNEQHYIDLGNYLLKNKIEVSHIFHGWTITDESSTFDYELTKFIGMYSVYFLQNHILNKYNNTIYLAAITNGISQVTDTIHCNKGTLVGAFRSLSYEVHNIKHLILDIGFNNNHDYLLNFILNPDSYVNDPYYAKRLSQLWKEAYTPLYFDEPKTNIKDHDVIIITGGLGGLGLVIAKEISTKHQVDFIMLTKSAIASNPNPEYRKFQLNSLDFIQNNGCKVQIMLCDVGDAKQISKCIATVKRKFGQINGVIHTASSTALLIQQRNLANMQEHIKAKVEGAINLLDSLKNEKLKFFALTSSLDALVGGIGVFEYCAANSFLDTLSTTDYPDLNLISINWPNWENIGMNVKFNDPNIPKRLFTLSEEEGAKIFYNLINQNYGLNRVAVSKIDVSRLKASEFHKANQINSIPHLAQTPLDRYLDEDENTELENKIAEVFCTILGQKKLSKYKSFFSLGGNSLTAIKLLTMLNARINSSTSILEFYANDKVASLAVFIEAKQNSSQNTSYINEGAI
jgi:3-oxoacyl-(acyl-carrier-protein) synthase/malonyl CoA-acyl carrier protein transacylase/NADP-dependent 3-hydroxy acid dehydrogenase YdfG